MQEKGQKCKKSDANLYTKKQAVIACLSRFLLNFLISNVLFPYIELHPAFDTLFRLSQANEHQNSTIELAKTQAGIKKEPTKEALNLNGGNDEARTRDLMRDRHAL